MKGLFITFEGCEGCGKTTIMEMVASMLKEMNIPVYKTREPGGVKISEEIRNVILNVDNTAMEGRTEALLYAASRRQHLVEVVIPKLNEGYVVLCDRYVDSSLAYQGYARGIGIDEVLSINEFAINGLYPDKTIFLDCKPEVGLTRIGHNDNREVNRLDKEALSFHNKVYEGYKIIEERFPDRFININGENSLDKVYRDTLNKVLEVIKNNK